MSVHKTRIMYLEPGGGLAGGGARIGLVVLSKTGRSLYYAGRTFRSLAGRGYKANYYDVDNGGAWWISGPRHDGNDALYPEIVEIDEDVRVAYWTEIRSSPELAHIASFRSPGKYTRRQPHPELAVHGVSRNGSSRRGRVPRDRG